MHSSLNVSVLQIKITCMSVCGNSNESKWNVVLLLVAVLAHV
jgi:hypothetical protein